MIQTLHHNNSSLLLEDGVPDHHQNQTQTTASKSVGTHAGVHLVWYVELLTGIQNNWGNGWVVGMAYSWEEVVDNLQSRDLFTLCNPHSLHL